MANPIEVAETKREHRVWLEDYARWRSEHLQALMMLTRVQATILEREAALEAQAAEVCAHEVHLQEFDVVEYGPGSPDFETLESAHSEFVRRHNDARAVYEQTKISHINILSEVGKLFEFSNVASNRSAT